MSQRIGNDVISSELPGPVKAIESFESFFEKVVRGSYALFFATILAFIWANLYPSSYHSTWHTELTISLGHFQITNSLVHWIDEALMTLFFFTVGLEIKRELLVGELASLKRALLPIAAALGGMLLPAAIYAAFNYGTPTAKGWGIPMATDIAFSLGVLAILRDKVPLGLRIFLSAFAIADDLGAVLIIALFYTQEIVWQYLIVSGLFLVGLALANRLWIEWTLVYALLGIGMWFAILGSGVHATVAGVLVAMFIPARARYDTDAFLSKVKEYTNEFECEPGSCGYTILLNQEHLSAVRAIEEACHDVETPLQRLEHGLQPWVSFLVLPLFALANAGLVLEELHLTDAITHPVTLGVTLGLVVGKPLGIFIFTYLASKTLKAPLPSGVRWFHIIGAGILGGIGFTMSLFISGLSFGRAEFAELSKLGIIMGSLVSGLLGLLLLGLGKDLKSESSNSGAPSS
jgi:NhaA family Na+:H+ antiporter